MTSSAEKTLAKYSIGGLYRLLKKTSGCGYTISQLAPTFGKSRPQARKYVKVALGLGLLSGDVHERESGDRRLKGWRPVTYRRGWDRYYSATGRGKKLLERLERYADGKPEYGYPDPPLLGRSTPRHPRFPRRY